MDDEIDEAPLDSEQEEHLDSWALAMFWDGKKRVGRSYPIHTLVFLANKILKFKIFKLLFLFCV